MSLDRSFKSGNSLVRHRNVLTRGERLDKLKEDEKWDESKSVFNLPKVEHRKQVVAKVAKEEVAAEGAAAPAAGAAPVAGAAPAAGAKGAAPAAGAKGAAPAAGAKAAPAAGAAKKK